MARIIRSDGPTQNLLERGEKKINHDYIKPTPDHGETQISVDFVLDLVPEFLRFSQHTHRDVYGILVIKLIFFF